MVCWSIGTQPFDPPHGTIHLDPFGRSPRALPGRFNRKGAVGYHHRRWFACALPTWFSHSSPCGKLWFLVVSMSLKTWRPTIGCLAEGSTGTLVAPCESEFVFPPGNVAMPKMGKSLDTEGFRVQNLRISEYGF